MNTRRLLLACLVLLTALVGRPSATSAQTTTQLFPGVTYASDVQFTARGPVSIRVVRGPRPVGLYRLRTVLSEAVWAAFRRTT